MRKLFYLLAFALLISFSNTASSQKLLTNAFFFEFGGISPDYSINYEKIFAQNNSVAIATRMGFSINRTFLAVPVGITLITVPGMHHVQLTVGLTPQIEDYNSLSIQGSDTYLYIDSGIGYRFEKKRLPLFGFISVNPLLKLDPTVDSFVGNDDQEFLLNVGVALGYKW